MQLGSGEATPHALQTRRGFLLAWIKKVCIDFSRLLLDLRTDCDHRMMMLYRSLISSVPGAR
jgi:hypothetical protein